MISDELQKTTLTQLNVGENVLLRVSDGMGLNQTNY